MYNTYTTKRNNTIQFHKTFLVTVINEPQTMLGIAVGRIQKEMTYSVRTEVKDPMVIEGLGGVRKDLRRG